MTVTTEKQRIFRRGPDGRFEAATRREPEGPGSRDDGSFRVGHLSDLHDGKPLDDGVVSTILGEWLHAFREAEVELVVCSGDLVETPDDRVGLLRMRHVFEQAGLPVVYVPGNHDVGRPGSPAPFYELFGPFPRVERHGEVDVVLVDSLGGLPAHERSPLDRLEALRTGAYSRGRVGRDQLDAVSNMLEPEAGGPRLLVTHHHLAPESAILENPPESGAPETLMVPCLDADEVLDWAADHGVRAIFHGHKHAYWPAYTPRAGLAVFNSGSSTRGKPKRRARIVDLERGAANLRVWTLRHE